MKNLILLILMVVFIPVVSQSQGWAEYTIDTSINQCYQLDACDLDGDDDIDVVGHGYIDDFVCWWENTDGTGMMWTQHYITDVLDQASSIASADIDGDGDPDVIGAAVGDLNVHWWENADGMGTNWNWHTINGPDDQQNVIVVDIDGDNDFDILTMGGHAVIWWENDNGDGSSWTEHLSFMAEISTYFWDFCALDIDGDSDFDILTSVYATNFMEDGRISWWENVNGNGISWTEHIVETLDINLMAEIDAADLDGDGDNDILREVNGETVWLENVNGDGSSWAEDLIAEVYVSDINYGDLDFDGDMDVVVGGGNYVAWFENQFGIGVAWSEHIVNTENASTYCIQVEDVNNDIGLDILGSFGNDEVFWFENPDPLKLLCIVPLNEPVYVHPNGGPFWYNIELRNIKAYPLYGTFITEVVLPDQVVYGPILSINLALGPYQTLQSPILTLEVPGFAPSGDYLYRATFTTNEGETDSDEFPVVKLEGMALANNFPNWNYECWDINGVEDEVADVSIPNEFAICDIYPNPFNPTTTISVALPEATELNVSVYNVRGQLVSMLANGTQSAGYHSFTFDANHLASGIYLVRSTVPGKMNEIRKVVLVK